MIIYPAEFQRPEAGVFWKTSTGSPDTERCAPKGVCPSVALPRSEHTYSACWNHREYLYNNVRFMQYCVSVVTHVKSKDTIMKMYCES